MLSKNILGSLVGRDFDSLSASLGVRSSNSGGGPFAADFRSGLGNYTFLFCYYFNLRKMI